MTLHLAPGFLRDRAQVVRRRWLIVTPGRLRGGLLGPDDLGVHVPWPHLRQGLLAALAPDTVVAPLMTPGWDVLDLAAQLHGLGYTGRVLIDAPRLPRPAMVLAEVQAQCPTLAFGFLAA